MKRPAAILLAIALATVTGPASAHVPPPPPDDAAFVAASCSSTEMGVPDAVAATVAPLTDTPVATGSAGPLTLRWGVRIATRDPRVGDLATLAFSGAYGLLGATGRGDWLTFDLQGGSLARIKAVGVAPIRGAIGRPSSMVDLGGSLSFMAFDDAAGTLARFALSTCGTNATAVPWLTTSGVTAPVLVEAAYTYLGVVARDAAHGDTLLLPYEKKAVVVPSGANAFVPAGETLVALSNPARIVPYVLALTRPADARGRGATLRIVYIEQWDDVRGGSPVPPRTLLHLDRAPSAMAAFSSGSGTTTVILAFPTDLPGTIDLYRFDGGNADLDPLRSK